MATITSNGTGGGNSNVGASWAGGVVPVSGDKVIIAAGDTITMVADATWGDDPGAPTPGTTTTGSIEVNGTLKFSRTVSATLTCRGQLLVKNGGWLNMGSVSDPISNVAVVARLALNDSAVPANGKYGLELQDGGQWTGYGAVRKRWTKLATAMIAGSSTTCGVTDATGWQIGDEIYFGSTQAYNATPRIDRKTLTSVSGNTIGWSGAVTYAHAIGGHVANASSNVRVTRSNASFQTYVYAYHLTLGGNRRLDHVELNQIGVNTTNKGGLNIASLGTNNTVQPWAGIRSCAFRELETNGLTMSLINTAFINEDNVFLRTSVAGTGINMLQCGDLGSIDDAVMMGVATGISPGSAPGSNALIVNRPKITGGGTTAGINMSQMLGWVINDPEIGGLNLVFSSSVPVADFTVNGGYIGAGVFGTNTTVVNISNTSKYKVVARLFGSTLQASGLESGLALSSKDSQIIVGSRDNDPFVQQIYTPNGTITRDTSGGYPSGGDAIKFEPTSAVNAIYNNWQIVAPDAASTSVAAFVKRSEDDVTVVATLSGAGITPVTQTLSGGGSTVWELIGLTAVQNSGGDTLLTFKIEVTGTNGAAWVDALSAPATVAVDTGDLGYWAGGRPAAAILANYVTQSDLQTAVWGNVIESGYTAAEILRLVAAVSQGNANDLEGANPVFKSINGSKNRIQATYTSGTRTITSRDAT
jgi:hypothetical protein